MKIVVKEANEGGSGYPFTLSHWLTDELSQSASDSKVFEQKHGKDWTLFVQLLTNTRLKKPKVYQPNAKWEKTVCYIVVVPYIGSRWADPGAYIQPVQQWLEGIASVLRIYRFDSLQFEQRIPALLDKFVADHSKVVLGWVEAPADPLPAELPKWKAGKDVRKCVTASRGTWEDERYDPILLTVSVGVEYQGREIPLMWQIEFDPFDERLQTAGKV